MKVLNNLLDIASCNELATIINSRISYYPGDPLVPISHSAYGLPETEKLLLVLTDKVSEVANKRLIPTYSYCRIYLPGAILEKHVDRFSCEYSVSLRISGDQWPIWFDFNGPTSVQLDIGAGVLYSGLETPHWREEFTGKTCTQVFLHWVDADGPHASWAFDRRPAIGVKKQASTTRWL